MPKISRPNLNVLGFGYNAGDQDRTIFGEKIASDDLTANMNSFYSAGWEGISLKPPRQWENGAKFTISQLVSYLFQMGISEWNTNQEYYVNSKCTSPVNGFTYVSKTGTTGTPNVGNNPTTDTVNWRIDSVQTVGNQTVDGTKTFSSTIIGNLNGNISGNASGNAGTATKLQTARTINGVQFNGTANITVQDSTKVPTNSVQALNSSDALRISGNTLSLHKGNGTSESVSIPNFDNGKSFSTNGYQKFGDGLIIQWGSRSSGDTTFPISFPNAALQVVVQVNGASSGYDSVVLDSLSRFGFSTISTVFGNRYIAIGY